ncbi:tetratricopeptide repeat protein [Kiloniella sp. EL199]|uniref:tetratricopeptide repeat protein n=1 Tax=Kiloniella sp. EL199 TaxID=2107581 RepID=UPI000EA10496|nr:tetratricopeptide repeat protein [Kiloniella sp. EL199]
MKRFFIIVGGLALLAAGLGPALHTYWSHYWGPDIDEAALAYDIGDYETAMDNYLPFAEGGTEKNNLIAMFNVALMYEKGQGVTQNYDDAEMWFTRAAELGNVESQNKLGHAYEYGDWGTEDFDRALLFYGMAADQGDVFAQGSLARMYLNNPKGDTLPKAVKWLQKAVDGRDAFSEAALAYLYETGNGVPLNPERAFNLYRRAAKQSVPFAQNKLANIYHAGVLVPQDYKLAHRYFTFAAEQQDIDAQINLAEMYARGEGMPRDLVKAYMWLSVASALQNASGQNASGPNHSEKKQYAKALLANVMQGMASDQIEKGDALVEKCLKKTLMRC